MNNPIASAIKEICDKRGLPQEDVIEAVESMLASAYRKDFAEPLQNVKVEFDIKNGEWNIYDVKTVVEDPTEEELNPQPIEKDEAPQEPAEGEELKPRFNPKTDIGITSARESLKSDAEIGDEIKTKLETSAEFGRMAAQTAKQVLIQKILESERSNLFQSFKDKEGTIIIGTVQRKEEHRVLVDMGKVTAILPNVEQNPRERYYQGDRIKVYVVSVEKTSKGPEIILSRTHPGMVRSVFESEIPEISNGAIEIKGISREAGQRSKVAVHSHQETIDPIGSCIGQRGSRIQTIISELGGEKVDVILYDEDPSLYISNALSPAKVSSITLNEAGNVARVLVKDDQLSLAIGKGGQNVRLASQLTGWNIEVRGETDRGEVIESEESAPQAEEQIPEESNKE
ncbi:MAG: transcription termination factor NusA [Patescibacteria group bacterium]